MMADDLNFLGSQTQNNIADADADLTPVLGHGALFVAELIVGMEELELDYTNAEADLISEKSE